MHIAGRRCKANVDGRIVCCIRSMRCYFVCGTTSKIVYAMFVLLLKRHDGWFSSVSRVRHTHGFPSSISASALTNSHKRYFLDKNMQTLTLPFSSPVYIQGDTGAIFITLVSHCESAQRQQSSLFSSLFLRYLSLFLSLFSCLFLFQPCSNSPMVSRVGAFTVRTFYFLTSNVKVTYAPGYESLCTIREN